MFLAGAALTAAPWLARNAIVMGSPVLTTQGGITLYSSYRPPQGKVFGTLVHDETVKEAERLGEAEADRRLTRAALRAAADRPLHTMRLSLLKALFFWTPIDWEVLDPPGRPSPVFLFALPLALVAAWRERARLAVPIVLLAGLTIFSAAVYGSPRLRMPYEFLLDLMAAVTINGLLTTRNRMLSNGCLQPIDIAFASARSNHNNDDRRSQRIAVGHTLPRVALGS